MVGKRKISLAVVVLAVVAVLALLGASLASATGVVKPEAACPRATPGAFECMAVLAPVQTSHGKLKAPDTVTPAYSGTGVGGAFSPADLQSAYALPSGSAGNGSVVAIVDAYDDPDAESDLAVYRSHYGLSACTTANGCFRKVDQNGGSSYPSTPPSEDNWDFEISLDLDMVSATCPNCRIVLIEANTNSFADFAVAEKQAVAQGATAISNSWGAPEFKGETSLESDWNHPLIPTTFSAGDEGYGVLYPAASPNVIAVGGTALYPTSGGRGWTESVWSGSGSGCSAYEPKPAWQYDNGCSHRTNNDVSAVAAGETPVSVYDSAEGGEWWNGSGTSAASPIVAATMAMAPAKTRYLGAAAFYDQAFGSGTGALNPVTSGSNGSCGTYLCNGGSGYNGPAGVGTPSGAPSLLISSDEGEVNSGWAMQDPNSRSQFVYYGNTGSEIANWNWTPSFGWNNYSLGGTIASGTVPAAVRDATDPTYGGQYVYFVNSSHEIANWNWTLASGWNYASLGSAKVALDTSPTVVRDPSTGSQFVYFVNAKNEIATWNWTPSTGWGYYSIGGKVAPGTSPVVVRQQGKSNGGQYIYFVNANHEIATWNWTEATGWNYYVVSSVKVAPESSPTAVRDPTTGSQYLYFVNASDEIGTLSITPTSGWGYYALGGKAASGTSPVVIRDQNLSSGGQYVYFVNANHEIANWNWTSTTGWGYYTQGGKVAAGTSPVAIRDAASTGQYIYFLKGGGGVGSFSWTPGTGWNYGEP
jgi:hypothetical protein